MQAIKSWITSLCLFGLAVTGEVSGEVLEFPAVKAAMAASARPALVDEWLSLARAGEFETLGSEVQGQSRFAPSDLVREHALYSFIMGLRHLPPQAVPVDLLQRLTKYRTQVFYWHPESRGTLKVPLFNVAGAAQGTLRFTERKRARMQAEQMLNSDPGEFWSALRMTKRGTGHQGFLDALRRVPLPLLRVQADAVRKSEATNLEEAKAIVALRLQDMELAGQVIRQADPEVARPLVTQARQRFEPEQAFALLKQATERPGLASVAVYAIGDLARQHESARTYLMSRLGDPHLGASAAAALAPLADETMIHQVVNQLGTTSDPSTVRNCLLLLHLNGSNNAQTALRQFVDNPLRPQHLRDEVRRWLPQ